MNSSDEDEVVAALTTLSSLGELDFDKASYREAILPHLESDRAEIRLAASFALATSGLQEGDAEKLRQMAREGMGPEASRLLMQIDKMDLTGESGAIVASMVQQGGEFAKKAVQGLWGGKYSPELEASLVEMSRDADIGYEVMYFALSTQRNKGQETVSRLIEILGDSDTQNRAGRAAWGLSYGVEKEQWSEVADAALILVDTRVSGYAWQQAWELVRQYAGEEQVDDLKVLAEKPNVPSKMREMLLNKITALESQNP
ncbi:hypothetical protein HNR46_003575 [Haloferula luteola]|uniref:HEAT repeat domain-containing protein n=1 Tax=Haloferula luteola TaxID=595692 RepID=A0A840VHP0_9BACT|nr:hypothetical protein [Haloferula luteola]MBB5353319.1 hypothetical protein [Haloferula luteola]